MTTACGWCWADYAHLSAEGIARVVALLAEAVAREPHGNPGDR